MQMTLIHDLAECIVGDITPYCGVPPDEKHRLEDEAMEDICKLLDDKGSEILQIFRVRLSLCCLNLSFVTLFRFIDTFTFLFFYIQQEYEKQESPEAQYVKDLDRLDLLMQAYEYEKRDNSPGKLEEFFVATNGKIRHPFINKIAIDITAERDALVSNSSVAK